MSSPGYGNQPQWPGPQPGPQQSPWPQQPGNQYPPPPGYGPPVQPWGSQPGSAPPRRKTGLIVGVIVGVLVLVGLVVGGVALLSGNHKDSDKSASNSSSSDSASSSGGSGKGDPTKLTDGCKLLDSATIGARLGISQIQSQTKPAVPSPDGKGVRIGCSYTARSQPVGIFSLTSYRAGAQTTAGVMAQHAIPGQQPVSGVGDVAAYGRVASENVLIVAATISGHTVFLDVTSPQPQATVDLLSQAARQILANVKKQS